MIWYEKAEPTIPAAVNVLVIAGGAVTVMTRVAVPEPDALVALIVTFDVPTVVGDPDTAPVDVFTLRPTGRPVALKLVGVLLAVIW